MSSWIWRSSMEIPTLLDDGMLVYSLVSKCIHNETDMITFQAPIGTAVEQYLLAVTVNGSSLPNFNTVPASNTSVSIFEVFPNIIQRRYTMYSLRVASISGVGQSRLTDSVSIGKMHVILLSLLYCS